MSNQKAAVNRAEAALEAAKQAAEDNTDRSRQSIFDSAVNCAASNLDSAKTEYNASMNRANTPGFRYS